MELFTERQMQKMEEDENVLTAVKKDIRLSEADASIMAAIRSRMLQREYRECYCSGLY